MYCRCPSLFFSLADTSYAQCVSEGFHWCKDSKGAGYCNYCFERATLCCRIDPMDESLDIGNFNCSGSNRELCFDTCDV